MLAMTDKRSILFQILFAVFDSLQGFVIVMVHCILRREVEDDSKSSFLLCLLTDENCLPVFFFISNVAGSRFAPSQIQLEMI